VLASFPMNHPITRVALLCAVFLLPFRTMTPQQAAQSQRFPQFENEEVSVWKTVVTPNAPLAMHTHQHPRVIIALSGGAMKVVNEDGTSEMHPWETGKAYWLPASEGLKRHADQNTGNKPIEVMVVELKKAN
jgi:quercetin dioxygenase-like cupin family protein